MKVWSGLCQPSEQPTDADFLAVYPVRHHDPRNHLPRSRRRPGGSQQAADGALQETPRQGRDRGESVSSSMRREPGQRPALTRAHLAHSASIPSHSHLHSRSSHETGRRHYPSGEARRRSEGALAERDVYLMTVSDVPRLRPPARLHRGLPRHGGANPARSEAEAGNRGQRAVRRGDDRGHRPLGAGPARPGRSVTARSSYCRWTTASASAPASAAATPSGREHSTIHAAGFTENRRRNFPLVSWNFVRSTRPSASRGQLDFSVCHSGNDVARRVGQAQSPLSRRPWRRFQFHPDFPLLDLRFNAESDRAEGASVRSPHTESSRR